MPRSIISRLMPGVPLGRVGLDGGDDQVGIDSVPDEGLGAMHDESPSPSPSRRAVMVIEASSEPVPGSVRAMAVTSSPEATPATRAAQRALLRPVREIGGLNARAVSESRALEAGCRFVGERLSRMRAPTSSFRR